ncbi:MAG: helix-turn-helix transcriptional regulator [Bacteroidales bacterium]|nr:helix-turn-helix transcriptional regulator [Bacteroidales bacterium]
MKDTTMEMKDRIAHIIRAKNLTAAEFALKLGIQPSNISHLLSGRNNPSLDFVKKLKETFPEYNLDWIIFGRGPVTVSEPFVESAPVGLTSELEEQEKTADQLSEGSLFDQPADENLTVKQVVTSPKLELKQIVLVYSDNTFELILPR